MCSVCKQKQPYTIASSLLTDDTDNNVFTVDLAWIAANPKADETQADETQADDTQADETTAEGGRRL